MISRKCACWPVLGLVLALGCGPAKVEPDTGPGKVDRAYEKASTRFEGTDDDAKRVAIAERFLERYPDSAHTAEVLHEIRTLLGERLDRPDEAYAIFAATLAQIDDPDIEFAAQKELARLHAHTRDVEALTTLTRAMQAEREVRIDDYLDVLDTATRAEAWSVVLEQSRAMLPLATPEAWRAQYPESEPEYAELDEQAYGGRRLALAMAYMGWAQEHLGLHDEALRSFAAATDKTMFSILGVDTTPLHLNWGKTLLRQDRPEEAMEKLVVEALYGNDDAMEVYERAWVATHGSNAGLEDHLFEQRRRHGVQLPRFALDDYAGNTIDTEDYLGEILLVVAWFPT